MMGAPRSVRWGMVLMVIVAALAAQLLLPEGHVIRVATGGRAAIWGGILATGAIIWAYARGLSALKRRARVEDAPSTGPFASAELTRYARHMMLREVGGPGQKALKDARVLVIGAGGLGSPVLLYLAAAGVGVIGVIDGDEVDSSNLQRQVIHRDQDIGEPKVFSAERAMRAVNPFISVRPYHRMLDQNTAPQLFSEYDLIIDGTDGFDVRQMINAAAVAAGVPLIAGAISQWEGQLSLYHPAQEGPCYACVFPNAPAPGQAPTCAEAGVIGPLPGVIGTMMALEAVKYLTGAGDTLRGRMVIYDGLYGDSREVAIAARSDCAVCGG